MSLSVQSNLSKINHSPAGSKNTVKPFYRVAQLANQLEVPSVAAVTALTGLSYYSHHNPNTTIPGSQLLAGDFFQGDSLVGISNLPLDCLAVLAGLPIGGYTVTANIIRVINGLLMTVPHDDPDSPNFTVKAASYLGADFSTIIYLLASGLMAIGWASEAGDKSNADVLKQKDWRSKIILESKEFKKFTTEDLPLFFKNRHNLKQLAHNFKQKPGETIGKSNKALMYLHAILALASLPFFLLGFLLEKFKVKNRKNPEQVFNIETLEQTETTPPKPAPGQNNQLKNQTKQASNWLSKIGWVLAGLSRLPLFAALFARGFNKELGNRYGKWYSILTLGMGMVVGARSIFPFVLALDPLVNIFSTICSALSRKARLKIKNQN